MTRYAVALGSNMGNRIRTLRSALEEIRLLGANLTISSLYESAPIGGPEQGAFLNAVVAIESDLSPGELLDGLQAIERSHDRVRAERWGPRTLDLDIVLADIGAIDQSPTLVIPHPRAAERLFVVKPLSEIWPNAELIEGTPLDELTADLVGQDLERIAKRWADDRPARWLVAGQLLLFAAIAVALIVGGELPGRDGWGLAEIVGLMVGIGGLVLIWSAATALGPNMSILPTPVSGGEVVSSGPYRMVRHPTYTAVLLLFVGVALLMGSSSALILSAVLGFFFLFKARYEESELRAAFPEYRGYMARVRARFVPFLI